MSSKNATKAQLLKAIEQLEKNPHDKLGILADVGIGVVGAGAAGGAAVLFGGGSVPILFGLMALPVAAPLGVVIGGAALGAAGLVGAKRIFFDGKFSDGQRAEMLNQLKEQLKQVETKEQASQLNENDKTQFIISLKEPIKHGLISPEDAQNLINAVQNGQIKLKEAIQMVRNIVQSAKPR
jgi:hypothetical protein